MNKKEISLLLGLVLTIAFAIFMDANTTAQRVCKNTLRLHIIANSNEEVDQKEKLLVKREILKLPQLACFDQPNFQAARGETEKNLEKIGEEINDILAENGSEHRAKCTIEPFYFSTGAYPTFTLPQGEYSALTVRLGKAQGKNWWCVMYPGLCREIFSEESAEGKQEQEQKKAVSPQPLSPQEEEFTDAGKITLRFKAVEVYEDIKNTLTHKRAKAYVN